MEASESRFPTLPAEVLLRVFANLCGDNSTLLSCILVLQTWCTRLNLHFFKSIPRPEPIVETSESHNHPTLPAEMLALPAEILLRVFANLSSDNLSLHSCILVSRTWYLSGIFFLYSAPTLTNQNFDLFSQSLVSDFTTQNPKCSQFVEHVRVLSMGQIKGESSRFATFKFLRTMSQNLEVFVAPKPIISTMSVAELSNCHNLREIDLSAARTAWPLFRTLQSISGLPVLGTLHLGDIIQPRLDSNKKTTWPKRLRNLSLRGFVHCNPIFRFNIDTNPIESVTIGQGERFSTIVNSVPFIFGSNFTSLDASKCSHMTFRALFRFAAQYFANLRHLSIADGVVRENLFDTWRLARVAHPLESITIKEPCCGPSHRHTAHPRIHLKTLYNDIETGVLGNLRSISFDNDIQLKDIHTTVLDLEDLANLVEELEKTDSVTKGTNYIPRETGVWTIIDETTSIRHPQTLERLINSKLRKP